MNELYNQNDIDDWFQNAMGKKGIQFAYYTWKNLGDFCCCCRCFQIIYQIWIEFIEVKHFYSVIRT